MSETRDELVARMVAENARLRKALAQSLERCAADSLPSDGPCPHCEALRAAIQSATALDLGAIERALEIAPCSCVHLLTCPLCGKGSVYMYGKGACVFPSVCHVCQGTCGLTQEETNALVLHKHCERCAALASLREVRG